METEAVVDCSIEMAACYGMGHVYRQQFSFTSPYLFPVNLSCPEDHFNPVSSPNVLNLIQRFLKTIECTERQVILWVDGSLLPNFPSVADATEGIVIAIEHWIAR